MPNPRLVRDTADACGDPLEIPCQTGDFRYRIWYVAPGCETPLEGYQLVSQAADCSQTPGDITDLAGSPVPGAVQVHPTQLGAGNFQVGAAGTH